VIIHTKARRRLGCYCLNLCPLMSSSYRVGFKERKKKIKKKEKEKEKGAP
jgi:hypothetical protein